MHLISFPRLAISGILILIALAQTTSACVRSGTVYYNLTRRMISGYIQDNGAEVCSMPGNQSPGKDGHFWFDCIEGYQAYADQETFDIHYSYKNLNFDWGTTCTFEVIGRIWVLISCYAENYNC